MRIGELNHKRVAILGYGREGRAMVKAIEDAGVNCEISIRDQDSALLTTDYSLLTGPTYLDHLDTFDVIIKSPGIPPKEIPESVRAKVTNSTQIFLEEAEAAGATVIGVTGTKGKSTTASLIAAILKEAGKNVSLIGNIGDPAIAHVGEIFCHPEEGPEGPSRRMNKIFVQEMSSYQLMNLTVSPEKAVITSFFPEHLDYHGSLDAYRDAKAHIVRYQKSGDVCVCHGNAMNVATDEGEGTLVVYSNEDCPLPLKETHLLGRHNAGNIAAAYIVTTKILNVAPDVALRAIKNFHGLPHRLESLGVMKGIEWVDDAISTTPESTIAAIEALSPRVKTLIVGGKDRGVDQRPLISALKRSSIETVIAMGETAAMFPSAIVVATMEEAIALARERTPKGDICLLSPAASSYDMYENFEEKGDAFKRAVTSHRQPSPSRAVEPSPGTRTHPRKSQ